jgi:hypothetical protein
MKRLSSLALAALLAALCVGSAHAQLIQGRQQVLSTVTSTTDGNNVVFAGPGGRRIKDGGASSSVPTSRTLSGTSPIRIDGGASGDLSANRTVSILAASGSQNGYLSSSDYTALQAAVPNTRTVSTTSPLGGGGALSGSLTLTCSTCAIGPGSSTATAVAKFTGTNGLTLGASAGVFIDSSDRLGLATSAPTHTLTLSSTATGLAAYNTSDQTTNYERGLQAWAANEYVISTDAGGSGTLRPFRLRGGSAGGAIALSPFGTISYAASGGTVTTAHTFSHVALTSTSILQTAVSIASQVNQASGSGGYNAFLCNPTLTAVGSAGAKCFRAQSSGADKWWIDAVSGVQDVDNTNTTGGTTGNQTISKPAGTVNVAASASSLTVTNTLVTTSSIINVQTRTNDSTCSVKNYVPGSGSFVINMTAACTAETSVGFAILDKN